MDITIVLWVLVVLVIAMLLYIASWWKHLRSDAGKPTNPAESSTPVAESSESPAESAVSG